MIRARDWPLLGHIIYNVEMKFRFLRTPTARVCCKHKISSEQHQNVPIKYLGKHDKYWLVRIVLCCVDSRIWALRADGHYNCPWWLYNRRLCVLVIRRLYGTPILSIYCLKSSSVVWQVVFTSRSSEWKDSWIIQTNENDPCQLMGWYKN